MRRAVKLKSRGNASAVVRSTRFSPTEQRNPRWRSLDRLPVRDAVKLMLSEEDRVPRILQKHHQELARAVERVAGAKALVQKRVSPKDVVLGIAASGTTPFVWGTLGETKRGRATTMLLCFNPYLAIPRALRLALVNAPHVGPEVLTSSKRLKAGTATKLV